MSDNVNHPKHYTQKPHGIECIEIAEQLGFLFGNAFKYVWRHRDKNKPIEDLQKALFYMKRGAKLVPGENVYYSIKDSEKLTKIKNEDLNDGLLLFLIAIQDYHNSIKEIEKRIDFLKGVLSHE